MQIQILLLDSIRLDGDTQSREGFKQEIINEYAEDMREGALFPPVVVYNDGKALWLSEGFHRVYAARQAGIVKIETEVREGSRRDAQLNSMRSNATHGARRTNADKRRAVEMAFRWLAEEGRSFEGITNVEVAEMAAVSEYQVRQLRDEIVQLLSTTSIKSKAQEITNYSPPDLTVTQKLKEEKERLQKDLNKAVEMATAAEAKAVELYKARGEAERLKAELEAERKKKLEVVEKTVEVEKIIEKPVEDPGTAFKLKKSLEEQEKLENELNRIKREQREMTRLEKDKVKLEAELKNLRMKARDEKAELTLYEAIDTIERVTFIRDRVHDLCNRNQLTISQLDKTETVLENLFVAIKEALVVVRASRGALTKEGGLRVVE